MVLGLSEADTRAKLIDPALHACGWTEDLIRREETAGAIEVINGKPRKRSKGRTDYTLRVKVNSQVQPVAVALIEAKAADLPPTHGLEQGKSYASSKRLNVPFVFSTNGHLFVEFDSFTGKTSAPRPLTEFPTPNELRTRYEEKMGFVLSDAAARPLLTPYSGGEATRRYYQDAAIRAVFEKMARNEKTGQPKRALLSLATGAGKTFIAVALLKRIADAGQLRRALFICDRDELRLQAAAAFQNAFGTDAAVVSSGNAQKNARVLIATYQTLGVDNEEASATFLKTNYPENYFSHIIIDECHRSAWGKWSEVLTRNPAAMQIGLTATPRELEVTEQTEETKADEQVTADNIAYFGEPVYEYDLSQGIEDGYLAACEIIQGEVNLDNTGITMDEILARKPIDANTGQPITREQLLALYEKDQFETKILLPDRVIAMCHDLFQHLIATGGPEQKTIIFCVRDRHADAIAIEMNNLYAEWCQKQGRKRVEPYAFKCTAASGSDYLAELRGASRSHFIATTVDLLTTGVDVPVVRNIVFFRYVHSPIAFYQMVGRGTRLDPATGKLMFRVYDYTDATKLFGQKFLSKLAPPRKAPGASDEEIIPESPEPVIQVQGFDVLVSEAGRLVVTMIDGKAQPVTVEEYKERLAAKLVAEAVNIDIFRTKWITPAERYELVNQLPDGRQSPLLVRSLEKMEEYDLFDVLAELAYGVIPRTRRERANAFSYKHGEWLASLPPATSATLKALIEQFALDGTDGLENTLVFQTPDVRRAGGLAALKVLGKPVEILRLTKERLFAA